MGVTDFCIVLDGKEYRFSANGHGELCFMCINGVDETIDVHDGYKRVNITNQSKELDEYTEQKEREAFALRVSASKCEYCCAKCGMLLKDRFSNSDKGICLLTGKTIEDASISRYC